LNSLTYMLFKNSNEPLMPQKEKTKTARFVYLDKWIVQNKKIDLRTIRLNDTPSNDAINWKGLEDFQSEIIPQLKAYQRVSKILPEKNHQLILNLLQANIHSAIQVASMSKQNFISTYSHLFSSKKITAEIFYNKALAIKTKLLLRHVQKIN